MNLTFRTKGGENCSIKIPDDLEKDEIAALRTYVETGGGIYISPTIQAILMPVFDVVTKGEFGAWISDSTET